MKIASEDKAPLLMLTALAVAFYWYGIDWGLPHKLTGELAVSAGGIDWAPDSLAPLAPLAYAKRLAYGEPWIHKYPPLHFFVLAVAYAPYFLYLSLFGGLEKIYDLYPYGFIDPEWTLTIFTLIARSVSAVMGIGLIITNYYIAKRIYEDWKAGFITGILLLGAFPLVHYSHQANIDIPHLLWTSLALLALVNLTQAFETKYYIMLGIFTALAFLTKESIYALFIGLVASLMVVQIQYNNKSLKTTWPAVLWKSVWNKSNLIGLSLFFIVLIIFFNPLLNYEGIVEHITLHTHRSLRGNVFIREASGTIGGDLNLLRDYLYFMSQINGKIIFALITVGVVYCLIRGPMKVLVFVPAMVTYYLFFLRVHGTHHLRYVLPLYLLLTWHGGKFLADLTSLRSISGKIATVVIVLMSVASLTYGFSVNILYKNDPRYDAERWIATYIDSDKVVVGISPEYSLPRFPGDKKLKIKRIWDYNGEQIDDIVGLDAEYIVMSMSIPRRREQRGKVEEFLKARGYAEVITFKADPPAWVPRIEDLHAVYPEIVILRRTNTKAEQHG